MKKKRMQAYSAEQFEVGEVFIRTPSSRESFIVTEKSHDAITAIKKSDVLKHPVKIKNVTSIIYLRKIPNYEGN